MYVAFLIELKVHQNGTAESDRVCTCNVDEGYKSVDPNQQFGQLDKEDCVLSTSQTGLCLLCLSF